MGHTEIAELLIKLLRVRSMLDPEVSNAAPPYCKSKGYTDHSLKGMSAEAAARLECESEQLNSTYGSLCLIKLELAVSALHCGSQC